MESNSVTNNLRHCQDQELSNLTSFFIISLFYLVISILFWPSSCSNSLISFSHLASLWCSILSPHTPLQNVCTSTEFSIFKMKFHNGDFLLYYLIVEKIILLILVNSRVELFNFCTHSLDLLLHFFPYNIESLSSNIVFSFQPISMFLSNSSFLK